MILLGPTSKSGAGRGRAGRGGEEHGEAGKSEAGQGRTGPSGARLKVIGDDKVREEKIGRALGR